MPLTSAGSGSVLCDWLEAQLFWSSTALRYIMNQCRRRRRTTQIVRRISRISWTSRMQVTSARSDMLRIVVIYWIYALPLDNFWSISHESSLLSFLISRWTTFWEVPFVVCIYTSPYIIGLAFRRYLSYLTSAIPRFYCVFSTLLVRDSLTPPSLTSLILL